MIYFVIVLILIIVGFVLFSLNNSRRNIHQYRGYNKNTMRCHECGRRISEEEYAKNQGFCAWCVKKLKS